MISKQNLEDLRIDLSIKSKNGVEFILAAGIIWVGISYIWRLQFSSYDKSVLTFIIGGALLPLALLLSKLLKTTWANRDNPLQPLGLWINISQLFYLPLLFFVLWKIPDYFIMVYAIITGSHFFLFSWFYKTLWYSIFAGIIAFGGAVLGVTLSNERMYILPLLMSISLFILAALLYLDIKHKTL